MQERTRATRIVRRHRGVPVYGYRTDPATPPVSLLRIDPLYHPDSAPHIHDFPLLVHVRDERVVHLVAPGHRIDPGDVALPERGTTVFFDPDALGGDEASWRRHPLLTPFLHGQAGGLLRVPLPASDTLWEPTMAALEAELTARRDGYRQALLAHLTLLLIDLARLTADIPAELRTLGEPLLAEVFDVIDRRFGEPLSLRDVAAAVALTPGHLTTVVRRRTGRTVQDWITERRMAAARALLADTDLPVAVVAQRVGLSDASYFSRIFRREHEVSPRAWRARVRG